MIFEKLLKNLEEGKTFEELVDSDFSVDCTRNNAYFDSELDDFLEHIGATVEDVSHAYSSLGVATIRSKATGKAYEVPYREFPCRMGDKHPDELVFIFDPFQITETREEKLDTDELRIRIDVLLRTALSEEYAGKIQLLDRFVESVIENIAETSAWEDEGFYTDDDIRLAIGREIASRLGIPV